MDAPRENNKIETKSDLSPKQRIFLFFYKSRNYILKVWFRIKGKIKQIINSSLFHLALIGISVFLLHKSLVHFNLNISEDNLHNFAFATAGIIGASIAIIFSFSTFILQSTADLFSTQYLKRFIENPKEKIFFWFLVLLTIISAFVPICVKNYELEILGGILFISFYLIYDLYRDARKQINPETTLTKIKTDAIRQLEKTNRELTKITHIQNKIFKYKQEKKDYSLDMQYRLTPNWHIIVLENVKYLFEIGLRLLSKNEINSFNLTLVYIHDIYLKHLDLRNGHFIRTPASIWGSYSFDDEGFTAKILEYMQSIGDRVIKEARKENIYFLLQIHESLISRSLTIKYADKNPYAGHENPLLNLIFIYYTGLIEKLLDSKENDWIWESIKSISKMSNYILSKTDDYYIHDQINQIIDKILLYCFTANKETHTKELVRIHFNQICIAWNKYEHNDIFWKNFHVASNFFLLVFNLPFFVNRCKFNNCAD